MEAVFMILNDVVPAWILIGAKGYSFPLNVKG